MIRHPLKYHSEQGAFLVLGAPLILTLLLLSIGVLSVGAYLRGKTAAQSALDLSLVAASREICVSDSCWNRVREFSLRSLRENLPDRDLSFVNLNDIDENGFQVTSWEKDGSIVSIERGRWLPRIGFQSMERDWQQQNPGVPREVVNFATRISLSLPVESLMQGILPGSLQININGTATANLATDAWVLPYLALPACALDGSNKSNICQADRFFAGIGEFDGIDAGSGEKFLNLPHTDYNLKDSFHYSDSPLFTYLFPDQTVEKSENSLKSCFFPTPWFKDRFDGVGAIGALGNYVVTESLIQSLATGGTLVRARIGDMFSLLPEKATDPATAKIIWNEIINASLGGATDANHRPLSEATDLAGIVRNINLVFNSDSSQADCLTRRNTGKLSYFRFPAEFLLSSFRSAFGLHDNFENRYTNQNGCSYEDSLFQLPQLSVYIPVIAEEGSDSASCNGDAQWLDASKKYFVVGFVPVKIFDIGKRIRDIQDVQYANENVAECTGISSDRNILNDVPNDLNPFRSSTSDDGYVVRARVDCGLKVTGSGTGGVDVNRPVLTE